MPQIPNWVANQLPAYERKKKPQGSAFAGLSVEKNLHIQTSGSQYWWWTVLSIIGTI